MNRRRALMTSFWFTILPCVTKAEPPPRTLDLFIFAGQSNMVGADADPAELPTSELDQRILFWWAAGDPPADEYDSTSGGKWQTLRTQPRGNPKASDGKNRQWGNFKPVAGGFGPEIGFARERVARLNGDGEGTKPSFAVLKVAYSGTSVENDWDPRQADQPGNCYAALVSQFQAARDAAQANGFRLKPAAFFWVQGESDSSGDRLIWYANRLTEMLAAMREDFGVVDLPVFLAVNTKFGGARNAGVAQVVAAQRRLADSDPNIVYVDTSQATIANGAHYDAAGTLLVGKLFAEAFRPFASQ